MSADQILPDNALDFIRRCIRERKVYWTYHVNMRLAGRHISREEVFGAADSYEVIELDPDAISCWRRRHKVHSTYYSLRMWRAPTYGLSQRTTPARTIGSWT